MNKSEFQGSEVVGTNKQAFQADTLLYPNIFIKMLKHTHTHTKKKLKPALWTFHSNGKLSYSNELGVVLLSIKLKHPHNS